MKTGGIADIAFFPKNEGELLHLVTVLKSVSVNFLILGNASNVLLPDDGLHCAVIFTTQMKTWHLCEQNAPVKAQNDEKVLFAECGVSITALSLSAAKHSLSGLEFAYGIPGTVGGAVFMNAGAYDGEIKNVVSAVTYLDTETLKPGIYTREQTGFAYRESAFSKNGGKIILGAYFVLKNGIECEIRAKANGFMDARREKQPLEFPSCGSAFKRPEGHFAGKLIEEAHLKGSHVGDAYISEKHAGFIVNKGNATSKDVLDLIKLVEVTVKEQSGITLEPEIKIIKE
jgi:UDP-N-acetylenolpyruvoylglucosamine reductase